MNSAGELCKHDHRIHPLGAGMFVCFACWLKLVIGAGRGAL